MQKNMGARAERPLRASFAERSDGNFEKMMCPAMFHLTIICAMNYKRLHMKPARFDMTDTIDHGTLSRLTEAGAVCGAHVVGQAGGWTVMVRYGNHERPLATQRSRNLRLFRRLETLVSYLKSIGIVRFDIDAAGYDPDALKSTRRPDRAEALKRAHEAAAYDAWFREQVRASIDDSRPSVSDEEAHAHFVARKAALRQRAP
jgi:hypothetical protein